MMRPIFAAICLLVTLTAGPAFGQKRAFTIEDLYRVRNASDLQVSPDGRTIAYSVSTTDLPRGKRTSRIWVMNANGAGNRLLTNFDKGDYSPVFSKDGKSIAFISTQSGNANLYIMPGTGRGAPRKVTTISTGVSDPVW